MEYIILWLLVNSILGAPHKSDAFIIPQFHQAVFAGRQLPSPSNVYSESPKTFIYSIPKTTDFHDKLNTNLLGIHSLLGKILSPLLSDIPTNEAGGDDSQNSGSDSSCSSCGTASMNKDEQSGSPGGANTGLLNGVLMTVSNLLDGLLENGAMNSASSAGGDEMKSDSIGMGSSSYEMDTEDISDESGGMSASPDCVDESSNSPSKDIEQSSCSTCSEAAESSSPIQENPVSENDDSGSLIDIDAEILSKSNLKQKYLFKLIDLEKSREKRYYKENSLSSYNIQGDQNLDNQDFKRKVYIHDKQRIKRNPMGIEDNNNKVNELETHDDTDYSYSKNRFNTKNRILENSKAFDDSSVENTVTDKTTSSYELEEKLQTTTDSEENSFNSVKSNTAYYSSINPFKNYENTPETNGKLNSERIAWEDSMKKDAGENSLATSKKNPENKADKGLSNDDKYNFKDKTLDDDVPEMYNNQIERSTSNDKSSLFDSLKKSEEISQTVSYKDDKSVFITPDDSAKTIRDQFGQESNIKDNPEQINNNDDEKLNYSEEDEGSNSMDNHLSNDKTIESIENLPNGYDRDLNGLSHSFEDEQSSDNSIFQGKETPDNDEREESIDNSKLDEGDQEISIEVPESGEQKNEIFSEPSKTEDLETFEIAHNSNSDANWEEEQSTSNENDNEKNTDGMKPFQNEIMEISDYDSKENNINNFERRSLMKMYLERIWRMFWPYLYTDRGKLPFFVRKMLSRRVFKRSIPSVTLKQYFNRPHFGQIPQSIAGSSLYGSYAFAHTSSSPHRSQEYGEEEIIPSFGEDEEIISPLGEEVIEG